MHFSLFMTGSARKLKIFIYRPKPARQTIWANWLFKCEPLELEYLYTVLKDYADITLIDGQVKNFQLSKEICRQHPDLLLITSLITNIHTVLKLATEVKKQKNPPLIFVGGPHAEVLPQHFFSPYIDGVFFNNQLVAIQKVVKAMLENKDYRDTAGTAFPFEGVFKINKAEKPDIKNFPIPKRPLLKKNKGMYNLFYFDDCASIKTSFGCPEKCTFCFCRKMNRGKYETRPVESVIQEIESIPNDNIFIVDDNFLISPKWLASFCKEIQRRNIKKQFIVYGTARFIARYPRLMKDLRDAGLCCVLVGIEFIHDDALAAVNKGSVVEENEECIQICKELEIEFVGLFMLDPAWPASEFKKLIAYVRSRKIYLATFATLTTLPGTDLWSTQDEAASNIDNWWRYDFLRLHQKPAYMSAFTYYLWLAYLYLRLAFNLSALTYFTRRAGIWRTIKMRSFGIISILDFLIKIIRWP
jgi:radical SAM superfamily enzyme YgiQ (UPF0313 family)